MSEFDLFLHFIAIDSYIVRYNHRILKFSIGKKIVIRFSDSYFANRLFQLFSSLICKF